MIGTGEEITIRDGRKMRLFYHTTCFSGSADPRTQPHSSFKHWSGISAVAPVVKGVGKWSVKAYGYAPAGEVRPLQWGFSRKEKDRVPPREN